MMHTVPAAAILAAMILGGALEAAAQTPPRGTTPGQPAPGQPAQGQPAQPARPGAQGAPARGSTPFGPTSVPTGQEMIRALIALQATPLASLRNCAGKGANESDTDVGDFLAGYASALVEQGHNWIVTLARPQAQPVGGVRVWRALVSFHRSHGDEDWAWGMEFLLRMDDHRLVPNSVTCVGMG